MAERDFKGIWIPAEIWLDDRLSAQEMVILAEIDSLDNGEGCWASNDYLARFSKCSAATVSRAVKNLTAYGYVEVVSFNGRTRIMKSCLRKMTRQTNQNDKAAESKCRAITLEDNVTYKEEKEIYKEKPTKHKHGEYQNVLLTEEDMNKLQAEFPSDWQTRIERLSEYMASTGKSYRNHLATIRNWARREKPSSQSQAKYNNADEEYFKTLEELGF